MNRRSFPVTDPDLDAPDGAVVDGYERVGDRWTRKRRPTRRDLLIVIGVLQDAIGLARSRYDDDRNPNGLEKGNLVLDKAHELCVRARSGDPPIETRLGPWGRPIDEQRRDRFR